MAVNFSEELLNGWEIRFRPKGDFALITNQKPVFSVAISGENISVTVLFSFRNEPLCLAGKWAAGQKVSVCFTGARIALYIDETLWDEEWPVGTVQLKGASIAGKEPSGFSITKPADHTVLVPDSKPIGQVKNFCPQGINTSAGDCMPFYHNGTYHLFYLFDRRHHKSKWGLGAHQWAHISTTDFVSWNEHPIAISIDEQYEGSICTGSVIFREGTYYAFYAVRMSDGSPARLTYSTSEDGIHFQKTGEYITLTPPFCGASARDPKVFLDENGKFHLLVTTSYLKNEKPAFGCIAHLVSDDLKHYTQLEEPFLLLDVEHEPECCDYFQLNGTYYFLYSTCGRAHYYISDAPYGPWNAPENNLVGHEDLLVPKTAFFQTGRVIAAGTNLTAMPFGGTVEFLEVKQNPDKSLRFEPVPELQK